jgi:dihydrofolate reductase
MGSGTYNAVKSFIKLSPNKLRIVLTRTPSKYKKDFIDGSLEFSSETPTNLAARLSKKYKRMLLVGGATTSARFLKEELIDEIYLTIEPKVFGTGIPLFAEGSFEADFRLLSIERLNKKGTILLKYKVK